MYMNPLDAVWLMMESEDTPMHVGVLATFQQPKGAAETYLQKIAEGMRKSQQAVAPWNCIVTGSAAAPLAQRLEEDPDFDLEYHYRHSALPSPGGERELGMVVSRLHSQPLDRSRPLWELHLIEGLQGDRFAFYIKLHHALIDNVNAIPMALASLAGSARKRNMPPLWTRPLSPGKEEVAGPDTADNLGDILTGSAGNLLSMGRATAGMLKGIFTRSDTGSFLLPRGTPRSTLNRQIGPQRRIATQLLDRSRVQDLADATDSTLNEILAYLCGSSLRRFFKEYNALPEESLIGGMPVSLQERSETVPGNAIAGLRVALGTHIGDPLARLDAIKESMKEVRADRASLPEDAVTAYVMMRAAPIYASQTPGLGRLVPPVANLTVSNTPGPDKALYYNGAKLEAIYPINALMQFSALSIDCVLYNGTVNIGFTGARDTLPHLQRLAVYLGQAVDDLEEVLAEEEAAR